MKKLLYISIAIIGLLITSCAPDKKNDPDSPAPSVDEREKFLSNWSVSENSRTSVTPNSYTVSITKSSSNTSAIIIENFYGLNSYTVSANVNGSTFIIPYQQVKDNLSSSLGFAAGSGTLTSTSHINLTYTTAIATNHDTCTASYSK